MNLNLFYKWKCWAWVKAQLVKYVLCKYKDLSSIPKTQVKKSRYGGTYLPFQFRGDRPRRILGACCSTSLAEPVSKIKVEGNRETQHQPLTSTCIHVYTHINIYTYIHHTERTCVKMVISYAL